MIYIWLELHSKGLTFVQKSLAPVRNALTPGENYLLHKTLVDPEMILVPPLHINLGVMKEFVESFPKDGEWFWYLCETISHLSQAKLKKGVCSCPIFGKRFSIPTLRQGWLRRKTRRGYQSTSCTTILGDVSEEQEERFYQNTKEMKKWWNINILLITVIHFIVNNEKHEIGEKAVQEMQIRERYKSKQ